MPYSAGPRRGPGGAGTNRVSGRVPGGHGGGGGGSSQGGRDRGPHARRRGGCPARRGYGLDARRRGLDRMGCFLFLKPCVLRGTRGARERTGGAAGGGRDRGGGLPCDTGGGVKTLNRAPFGVRGRTGLYTGRTLGAERAHITYRAIVNTTSYHSNSPLHSLNMYLQPHTHARMSEVRGSDQPEQPATYSWPLRCMMPRLSLTV